MAPSEAGGCARGRPGLLTDQVDLDAVEGSARCVAGSDGSDAGPSVTAASTDSESGPL